MTRMHANRLLMVLGLALAPSALAQTSQPATQPVAPQSQPSLTPEQWTLRGAEAMAAGDAMAALKAYEQALEQQPDNVNALIGLADAAMVTQDRQRAKQHYDRALKISPNDWRAHAGLGSVWLEARAYRMARIPLERAAALAPIQNRPRVLYNLALTYRGLYQTNDAIERARQAVALEPDNFPARYLLISLYAEAGRINDAIAENRVVDGMVREQLARQPDNVQAVEQLFQLASQRVELLNTRATAQPDDPAVRLQLVEAMEQQALAGQQLSYHNMLQVLEPLVEKHPDNPDVLIAHARLAYLVGRPALAADELQRALKIAPGDTRARDLLTRIEAVLKPAAAP